MLYSNQVVATKKPLNDVIIVLGDNTRSLVLLSSLALIGCFNKDTDGDGLTDREEEEFGSDPENADSDGDGLTDSEEYSLDSDPNEVDSDGDGYEDGWEVDQGSDPADADSQIYAGGWPYNPDKDSYDAPTTSADASTAEGSQLIRLQLLDQFGDMVDLYDFAGQGKYVAVDISAMWCGPCNQLAAAIANGNPNAGWGATPELVHNGDIFWLTVLGENNSGRIPTLDNLEDWYNDYPDDKVPVLADSENNDLVNSLLEGGWPTIWVFDEDLQLVAGPTPSDHWYALTFLNSL